MRNVVSSYRRKSIDDVADDIEERHGTIHSILKDEMQVSKVSERWVPHLHSAEEKEVCVRLSTAFLRRWHKDGMRFLNRIITTDETWVNYDPETKTGIDGVEDKFVISSKICLKLEQAKVAKSAKKIIYIFWTVKGCYFNTQCQAVKL